MNRLLTEWTAEQITGIIAAIVTGLLSIIAAIGSLLPKHIKEKIVTRRSSTCTHRHKAKPHKAKPHKAKPRTDTKDGET